MVHVVHGHHEGLPVGQVEQRHAQPVQDVRRNQLGASLSGSLSSRRTRRRPTAATRSACSGVSSAPRTSWPRRPAQCPLGVGRRGAEKDGALPYGSSAKVCSSSVLPLATGPVTTTTRPRPASVSANNLAERTFMVSLTSIIGRALPRILAAFVPDGRPTPPARLIF